LSSVFISYAREDLAEARSVAEALTARGLSVLWDRTIPTGRMFETVIEDAIASAGAVVVLWSRNSVRSDWVRAEAAEGAKRGILVPAVLDDEPPPLRYRISQTADLTDWRPGSQTPSFTAFLADIVGTVQRSDSIARGHDVHADPGSQPAQGSVQRESLVADAWIRRYLHASIAFAWLGSLALAMTAAFDYGVITSAGRSWAAAYWLTLASLAAGAASSILLGAVSFRSHFVIGTLQGWLWPVLAAVGQLMILMSAPTIVRSLPFANELESLLVFVLLGTIGPALLTIGAVITKRSLDAASQ
jgi:hypothetical protein